MISAKSQASFVTAAVIPSETTNFLLDLSRTNLNTFKF